MGGAPVVAGLTVSVPAKTLSAMVVWRGRGHRVHSCWQQWQGRVHMLTHTGGAEKARFTGTSKVMREGAVGREETVLGESGWAGACPWGWSGIVCQCRS